MAMSGSPTEVETLVAGGGIAGLASALGLARAGRKVLVLERAAEFGEVGAGIQLAPNALAALDRLGVLPAVMADAVVPERKLYIDAVTGDTIATIDMGARYVEHFGYPYVVAHRVDLHAALLAGCRESGNVDLENDREVLTATNQSDGRVLVACADGTQYLADVVIGADGVRSRLRAGVVGDSLVPSKYVAYRGAVPIEAVGTDVTSSPAVLAWVAPNMHLIQYPLRGGKVYNNVAVFRADSYSPDGDEWGTPEELDERFAQCCDVVREAGRYLSRDIRWPMYDRDPAPTWVDGRVALAGDAAHAMLQYLAQGGAQSLEDAVALTDALTTIADVPAALHAYEDRRLTHAGNIQRLARVAGDLFHTDGVFRLIRNYAFRDHDPLDYSGLEWMYMPQSAAPAIRSYPA